MHVLLALLGVVVAAGHAGAAVQLWSEGFEGKMKQGLGLGTVPLAATTSWTVHALPNQLTGLARFGVFKEAANAVLLVR